MDDFIDEPEEKISHFRSPIFKRLIASSLPTFLMRPITHPLDILKIRFQLQQNTDLVSTTTSDSRHYKSLTHAVKVICEEEGCRCLWRGILYSQTVSVLSSMLQFGVYGRLRKFLHQTRMSESPKSCDFLAGFLTGVSTAVIVNPFDLVRTHLLARRNDVNTSVFEIAKRVYAIGGVAQFFSGAKAGMWHAGILNGLRFMFYNIGCKIAMNYEDVSSHKGLKGGEMFLAGIGAGILANVIAYPMEFLKRRLQSAPMLAGSMKHDESASGLKSWPRKLTAAPNVCRAIVQCVVLVVRTEGPMAVYKGFLSNAIKSILNTAVQLSCYDLTYYWVGEVLK